MSTTAAVQCRALLCARTTVCVRVCWSASRLRDFACVCFAGRQPRWQPDYGCGGGEDRGSATFVHEVVLVYVSSAAAALLRVLLCARAAAFVLRVGCVISCLGWSQPHRQPDFGRVVEEDREGALADPCLSKKRTRTAAPRRRTAKPIHQPAGGVWKQDGDAKSKRRGLICGLCNVGRGVVISSVEGHNPI